MIRATADAVLALLQAQPVTVYDGPPPNLPDVRYVVLSMSGGIRTADRLCGDELNDDVTFSTIAYGIGTEQVRWAQEKAHAALKDAAVVIAGRNCQRIKHSDSQPIEADFDVDPPMLSALDVWRLITFPS